MQKILEKMDPSAKPSRYQKARLLQFIQGNSLDHLAQKIALVEWMKARKIHATQSKSEDALLAYQHLKRRLTELLLPAHSPQNCAWKDALFNTTHSGWRNTLSAFQREGLFHIDQPTVDDDFIQTKNEATHYSAILGITHSDSRANPVQRVELCLDAEYQYRNTGTTVDGIGVYPDLAHNRAILKCSKLTAKTLTQLAQQMDDPKQLFDALPTLFDLTRQVIKSHFRNTISESACAVMTKVFPYSDELCEVVTAGVGDCLAFAWLPTQKQVINLASAKQYDFGRQYNPLSVTNNLTPSMIQRSRILLPNNAVIFRLTDGAWQMLPNRTSSRQFDAQAKRHYIETSIDTTAMATLFCTMSETPLLDNSEGYREFLTQHIIRTVNRLKHNTPTLLQDDIPAALKEYQSTHPSGESDPTFAEFSPWLAQQNPERHQAWIDCLTQLECVIDLLQDVSLSELNSAFANQFELGDDTTFSVQCVDTDQLNQSANHANTHRNERA